MDIVSRDDWDARLPEDVNPIALPSLRLWVHHTASEQHGPDGVRDIQAYHMDTRGYYDIAYSFLIDDDGTIYEGRGVGVAGAHTEGDNDRSHACCLMGNFEERAPTTPAVDSLVALARHGRDEGWWIPTLGGHRDAPGAETACPGRRLYAVLGAVRSAVEEDPMDFDTVRRAAQLGTGDALSDPDHRAYQAVVKAVEDALTERGIPNGDQLGWIIPDSIRESVKDGGHAEEELKRLVREVLDER